MEFTLINTEMATQAASASTQEAWGRIQATGEFHTLRHPAGQTFFKNTLKQRKGQPVKPYCTRPDSKGAANQAYRTSNSPD